MRGEERRRVMRNTEGRRDGKNVGMNEAEERNGIKSIKVMEKAWL